MRNLSQVKRVVVKIGTNTLTKKEGTLDNEYFAEIAGQMARLKRGDKEIILVSSGAIGCGQGRLGIKEKVRDIVFRQALAAIGQDLLMKTWRDAFSQHKINVAQVLLTYDSFVNRKVYINLTHSMEKLLGLGVVPVINENDVISTQEIDASFGDNDRLSALVASKMQADLLILLSDIAGLYNKNPNLSPDAQLIREVKEITPEIEQMGGEASLKGVGGMKTKIEAAKICGEGGVTMIITQGKEKNILPRIFAGEELGTVFWPKEKIPQHKRWIHLAPAQGTIIVDEGAKRALENGKSLLPAGILKVEGAFKGNEVVELKCSKRVFAKTISDFSSIDLERIKGKKSDEVKRILRDKSKNVLKRENLVFV